MVSKQESLLVFRLSIACTCVIIGFILPLFVPWLIKSVTTYTRTLKPDGLIFETLRKSPVPIYYEFYMFNWTNPEDIYDLNVKPQFQEIGPFVFRSTTEKINITWNANSTVTFGLLKYWYFEEEKSVAPLSMKIASVDAVALSAAYHMRFQNYILKKGLDLSLRSFSQKLHVIKSVREILFDGYPDTLLDIGNKIKLPGNTDKPPVDKFGWFYARNGSTTIEGMFNAGTAEDNVERLYQWNYINETSYFTGECNKFKGSVEVFYPIPLEKNRLTFFWSEVCRPMTMDFMEEVVVDGILGYKYVVGDRFLDNGSKVHENVCYNNGEDLFYGVINISTCKYGAPGFLSLPHFYKADPYYVNKVVGLTPNKTRDELFVIHEPTTGAYLHMEFRFQLNMLLSPIKYISLFEHVPEVYLPVLWIEAKYRIPWIYNFALKLFLRLSIIMYSLSAIIATLGALLIWFYLKDKMKYWRNILHTVRTETEVNDVEQVKLSSLNQSETRVD